MREKYKMYRNYVDMTEDTKLNKALLLSLIFVSGGIFGFIYEELFYLVEAGQLMKRGMTFGPWIPVYGFGALLITLGASRLRKHPTQVFAMSVLASGILEFFTGMALFRLGGIRLWDYNVEKWNYGNIGGYVCLRSVLFFGISGLLLIYGIIPFIRMVKLHLGKKVYIVLAALPAALFAIDFLVSSVLLWQDKFPLFTEMIEQWLKDILLL